MFIATNSIEKRAQNCIHAAEVREVLFRHTQPVKQDGISTLFDFTQYVLDILDYLGGIRCPGRDPDFIIVQFDISLDRPR